MPSLNPDKLKIGYVILVATRKPAIKTLQQKAGFGKSSKWTHVAGSIGGFDAVEANVPRSRVINLQKEYVDRGFEVKVMRRKGQGEHKRYKVALWWATMNNLPYDVLQFFWFPLSIFCGKIGIVLHNLFSSRKRFLCSELIATGFYKEGDFLFGKSVENILPADFDNSELFEEVKDIWVSAP
ncbi:MAG: hypothetical protein KJ818_06565 [Candidatus Omnitrophica bacterium]|nr:hypothetical protein [Candidatus Margulisiibacteriota bacterium]MBU1870114.1 hypothetical protein [Candidatus Omnitrophota bacterium]